MSGVKEGSGEYLTRLGMGTPGTPALMVVDTGSDMVWVQCEPCEECYEQAGPVYDPAASGSFRSIPCGAAACGLVGGPHGCGPRAAGQRCLYQVAYGDGSFSAGELCSEVLRFPAGAVAAVGNVAIGCGHDNEGLFAGASGLLGLGGGPLSFVSQARRVFGGVFSYCLVGRGRRAAASTLTFGAEWPGSNNDNDNDSDGDDDNDNDAASGVITTPLLRNPASPTFYYVGLAGISVGGARVPGIPPGALRLDPATGDGGVIVDSGTSVSRLPEEAYGPLRSAFRAAMPLAPRFVGGFSLFDTCYDLSPMARDAGLRLPSLALHLDGPPPSVLALPAANYFVPVDSRGTHCLAFAPAPARLAILGNIQQQGFRVVFDTAAARLAFVPASC